MKRSLQARAPRVWHSRASAAPAASFLPVISQVRTNWPHHFTESRTQRTHKAVSSANAMYPRKSVSISRRPSSLIFSHDRFSAIVANQIERNSERDNVLEEKQAEIVHVMDAVNHDGVIRSRDQHAACGEEHANQNDAAQNARFRFKVANDQQDCRGPF